MKTWKAWTTGELHRLEGLRMDGRTIAECAAALGRTVPSVRNAVRQFPKISRAAAYLDEFNGPHTIAGVAAKLGVTKWAVKQQKRKLRRAGFDVRSAEGYDR